MNKQVLKAAMGFTCALGVLLLVLAPISYSRGQAARPGVVGVVNLMCQDPTIWCDPDRVELATDAFVNGWHRLPPDQWRRLADSGVDRFLGDLENASSSRAAPGRRLSSSSADGTAEAVLRWEYELFKHNKTLPCTMVKKMCVAPPSFNLPTECMCNGQWDHTGLAPTTTTAAINLTFSQVFAPDRRLAERAPGPWKGTKGAYCDAWDSEAGDPGVFCFTYHQAQCGNKLGMPYPTTTGESLTRSSGPCTKHVTSRSQYIIDGLAAMAMPSAAALALGVLFLILTPIIFKLTKYDPNAPKADAKPAAPKKRPEPTLEQKFLHAQKDVVNKLTDQTPESTKMRLYGLFKVAKHGSVHGDASKTIKGVPRPAGFRSLTPFPSDEQKKWDAWDAVSNLKPDEAKDAYIKEVASLGE